MEEGQFNAHVLSEPILSGSPVGPRCDGSQQPGVLRPLWNPKEVVRIKPLRRSLKGFEKHVAKLLL